MSKVLNAIQVNNLTKSYDGTTYALNSLSLTIKQGDFFGLLGANGAGKTTLIKIISTLLKSDSGNVTINNIKLHNNPSQAKRFMGIVPQEFNFNIFETVKTIILNQAGFYGLSKEKAKENCAKLLVQLNLEDKQNQIAKNLSGGMKRRLMIARALVHSPEILILDEPTAGVDIELRMSMWQYLKDLNAQGTTILLTTHYLEEAETLTNKIAIIKKGEIILQNKTATLLKESSLTKLYLKLHNNDN